MSVPVQVDDFDYHLPPERIAQTPTRHREDARLLRLLRSEGRREHRVFSELPSLLRAGDLLVINDTRVIPARFVCRRATGGRVDGLFLRETDGGAWEVLLRNAGRCRCGESLALEGTDGVELELLENPGAGRWRARPTPPAPAVQLLTRAGQTPLPPYIRHGRPDEPTDRERYQTVYAARPGAVAAPTAGLHFSRDLLDEVRAAGVELTRLTLHVGEGTFAPVTAADPTGHQMHSEWYELPPAAADAVAAARDRGGRVVAVGTTSVRVLETVARRRGTVVPDSGWTDLFLYPPAEFHATDALITNFHLPRSTLLMLVAAFCSPGGTGGIEMILDAYAEAVRTGYRFYSYGDAMLIE